jgi:hypothetical protein
VGFLLFGNGPGRTKSKKLPNRRIKSMANQVTQEKLKRSLSLDGWAVAIALLLAALVKLGALKHVGW